jgi:hypothetical protein
VRHAVRGFACACTRMLQLHARGCHSDASMNAGNQRLACGGKFRNTVYTYKAQPRAQTGACHWVR